MALVFAACTPEKGGLWIAGDAHFGARSGLARLDAIGALFPGAIGIVNLEGPVGTATGAKLLASVSIDELSRAGVRVAGVANNHRRDLGDEGERATLSALRASGVLAADRAPAIVVIGGARVAITAHDLTNGVPSDLAADLRAARAQADFLIATFHVAGPALYLPSSELKKAAEISLENDAALIVAHGSHTVAPIERRGDRVIAWGLGNVVFDCDCTTERDALVLHVEIVDRKITRVEAVPIEAGLEGSPAQVSSDPAAMFSLLRALGSSTFSARGDRASF